MQLFITDFKINGKKILIENENNLHQIKDVLRLRVGDVFFVQNAEGKEIKRYKIEIENFEKKKLIGNILDTTFHEIDSSHLSSFVMTSSQGLVGHIGMVFAMGNKRDKMELVVQKLSEIGIDKIILRPSERSVIKEVNEKKMERLKIISKEAVEQSRGRKLPEIKFVRDIENIVENNQVIVFDKIEDGEPCLPAGRLKIENEGVNNLKIYGIVGPEGGLTENDYKKFGGNYIVKNLGLTVLRMETACIIGAWMLKNGFYILRK